MRDEDLHDGGYALVETLVDLRPALAKLTHRQRQVLALTVAGWTQEEIGEELGIGQPRVWKHLAAARKKLAKHGG